MTRRRGLKHVAIPLRRWWRWGLGGLGLIVVVGLVVLAIWVLPQAIVQAELPKATTITDADRLKSINDVRGALLTALGALAVFSGSLVAYLNFRGTLELNRRGQVTERFTKAIDQLGRPVANLDVRIGAIYALEQIAKDSQDLHWPVMQVLTAFLREHAEEERLHAQATNPVGPGQYRQSRQDFLAISDVIRRRRWQWDQEPLDFSGADLNGARFDGARLPGAFFTMARLTSADFGGAYLAEAVFDGAELDGVDFEGAQLTGADFVQARLGGARFGKAVLERTDFEGAHLEGAAFWRAKLYGANFHDARLEGAVFTGAVLDRANFGGASGLNQPWQERLRQLVTPDETASAADPASLPPAPPIAPPTTQQDCVGPEPM